MHMNFSCVFIIVFCDSITDVIWSLLKGNHGYTFQLHVQEDFAKVGNDEDVVHRFGILAT